MTSAMKRGAGRRASRVMGSSVVIVLVLQGGGGPAEAAGDEPPPASVDVPLAQPVPPGSLTPPPVDGPPISLVPPPPTAGNEQGPKPPPVRSAAATPDPPRLPKAVTADKEPATGRIQPSSEPPRPEAAVSAIPSLPLDPDDRAASRDRGFPASSVQLGGGVSEFSLGPMRDQAAAGPYWDLRAVLGLRRLVAFETALVGAAYPMAGDRFGGGATLLRNGFEAGPRLNIPVEEKAGLILLYGTAGLGWANYRVVGGQMPAAMVSSDYAATLPLAAGITIGYERFLVDVRAGYRLTFQDELLTSSSGPSGENRLRDYSFGAQLGYEF